MTRQPFCRSSTVSSLLLAHKFAHRTPRKELPALYDRLRLDFELKEYQAREVVNNIADLTTYQ